MARDENEKSSSVSDVELSDEGNTFDTLDLSEKLLNGIQEKGYERPSPIQARGIRSIVSGRDIIAQAQSGTGKTAMFSIGILQRIDLSNPSTQAIIVEPTRELAQQTLREIESLSNNMNIIVHLYIGRTMEHTGIKENNNLCPQIIVATPGKLCAKLVDFKINTKDLSVLCLDEADQLLKTDFIEDVYRIFTFVPKNAQKILCSATMPEPVLEVTRSFMKEDAIKILLKIKEVSLQGIKQYYMDLFSGPDRVRKIDALLRILKTSVSSLIVFCNTVESVQRLYAMLKEYDYPVGQIHSGLEQKVRNEVLVNFRTNRIRVLIGTDLVARGIDVNHVQLVVNYDICENNETYTHRIGRCGRYGKLGIVINLVSTPNELQILTEYAHRYNVLVKRTEMNNIEL